MLKLSKKETLLLEMAFNKKKYKQFVYGEAPQIAQNWCLCMYSKLHRPDLKLTYLHWRSELELHINNLNTASLEKPKLRTKMTYEAMITDAELNNAENVFKVCRLKFQHENDNKLDISMEHQKEVCSLFADSVDEVVTCIGSDNIREYIMSTFPDEY